MYEKRHFVGGNLHCLVYRLEIITSDECILTAERFSWSPSWNFSYEESDSVDDAERIVRNLALDCKRAYGNRVCVRDHLTDQVNRRHTSTYVRTH